MVSHLKNLKTFENCLKLADQSGSHQRESSLPLSTRGKGKKKILQGCSNRLLHGCIYIPNSRALQRQHEVDPG